MLTVVPYERVDESALANARRAGNAQTGSAGEFRVETVENFLGPGSAVLDHADQARGGAALAGKEVLQDAVEGGIEHAFHLLGKRAWRLVY